MVDILQEGFPALPSPDEQRYTLETTENIREYLLDLVRALENQFNFQKTDADKLAAAANAAFTSPLTTKGDLLGYSTTNARIPVGTNGKILAADSTQATGVKWSDNTAAATQAEMEAASLTTVMVTPGRVHYHPGVVKAWVVFDGTTNVAGFCTISSSYNVTSVADNGTGDYTINFTNAFSSANYAMAGSALATSAGSANFVTIKYGTTPTTSAINIQVGHGEFTVADTTIISLVFFGDQ